MKYFALVFGLGCMLLVIVAIALGIGYLGFGNQANGFEVDIQSVYANNQNTYDNGFKKVLEEAQVPKMQVAGLKELYDGVMKGRYGANGSQAMLQMIRENNPTLNQETYLKIQRTIEEFHDTFQASQTDLISKKQAYQRFLSATTSGRIYNIIGHYPHIDLSKYDIVTSDQTQNAFQTKRAGVLQIDPQPATTK